MYKFLKNKLFAAVTASLLLVTTTVSASILGDPVSDAKIQFGEQTYYNHNVFYSTQAGVYQQTENYIEYTPNEKVKPIVTGGQYVHGTTNIDSITSYLEGLALNPVAGMNADFFSFQTGVPMSHAIVGGKVLTKDPEGQDAVGFFPDGTAFISWLKIVSYMQAGDTTIYIDNINKYRQPYGAYLFTDEYSTTTKNSTAGTDVIIGSISGDIRLGQTITGVVEEVQHNTGAIEIPKGKWVLSIDDKGFGDLVEKISNLKPGDTISFKAYAEGDEERWNRVEYGIGCIGGRLLTDGQVNELEGSAAPRTAIGIKEDGSIVFYTIDGRQSGHSYGVRLPTLAKRLQELGCVDAVNLDGGGSTSIKGLYPGDESLSLLNSPSEGTLRSVSNFVFLLNTQQPTGTLGKLFIYPYSGYYLSGTSQQFETKAVDTSFYKTDITTPVSYGIDNGTIYDSGYAVLQANDNNQATITAKTGDVEGSVTLNVIKTPTSITVYNESTWNPVSSIKLAPGETYAFSAGSTYGHNKLISTDSAYQWSVSGNVGTVDGEGNFTAGQYSGTGKLIVKAGDLEKTVDITIENPNETDNDRTFSKISTLQNGNQVKVSITSPADVTVDKSGIVLKADGKAIDFRYADNQVILDFEQLPHKLYMEVTNSLGATTLKSIVCSTSSAENPFIDTEGHWARDNISYMHSQGIVNGYKLGDGTFEFLPGNNITRAEFAVMLSGFLNIDENYYATVDLPYADRSAIPIWAINKVKAMYAVGIMTGRDGGDGKLYFDTTANINRSEVACAIARLLPDYIAQENLYFGDNASIPAWAVEGFKKLMANDILSGYEDNTIRPLNHCTRAEAVKILYSIY